MWLFGSHDENKNSDAVQIAQSPFLLELKFTIIICVVPKYSYDINYENFNVFLSDDI